MSRKDLNKVVCQNPLCNQIGFKPEYLAFEDDIAPGEEQNFRAYKCDHCQTRFYYSAIDQEDFCHHIELAAKYSILFFDDLNTIKIHDSNTNIEVAPLSAANCKFLMKKYQLIVFQ